MRVKGAAEVLGVRQWVKQLLTRYSLMWSWGFALGRPLGLKSDKMIRVNLIVMCCTTQIKFDGTSVLVDFPVNIQTRWILHGGLG